MAKELARHIRHLDRRNRDLEKRNKHLQREVVKLKTSEHQTQVFEQQAFSEMEAHYEGIILQLTNSGQQEAFQREIKNVIAKADEARRAGEDREIELEVENQQLREQLQSLKNTLGNEVDQTRIAFNSKN